MSTKAYTNPYTVARENPAGDLAGGGFTGAPFEKCYAREARSSERSHSERRPPGHSVAPNEREGVSGTSPDSLTATVHA
jgi:hypothetical protein